MNYITKEKLQKRQFASHLFWKYSNDTPSIMNNNINQNNNTGYIILICIIKIWTKEIIIYCKERHPTCLSHVRWLDTQEGQRAVYFLGQLSHDTCATPSLSQESTEKD